MDLRFRSRLFALKSLVIVALATGTFLPPATAQQKRPPNVSGKWVGPDFTLNLKQTKPGFYKGTFSDRARFLPVDGSFDGDELYLDIGHRKHRPFFDVELRLINGELRGKAKIDTTQNQTVT